MSGLLIRLLSGWRLIALKGRGLEALVSQAAEMGYRLWRVERQRDELILLTTENGYEAIKELVEGRLIEIRTVKRGGLPFRWRQIRRRPFLLLGLATAMVLVVFAMSHVWAIRVQASGLTPSQEQALVGAANRAGLTVGSTKPGLNVALIRRRMLQELPEYSWIGLHVDGMVAVIDGLRFVGRPPNHLPSRLIATRSGKITTVFVYMGAPDVSKGEEVKKGQVLISGVVSDVSPVRPKGATKPEEQSVVTPAEGEVFADTRYEVKYFQPFVEKAWTATGHRVQERFLSFDHGPVLPVPSWPPLRFTHYDIQKNVQMVRFAGVELPVRVIDLVYNEKVMRTLRLTRREAALRGRQHALAAMKKIVPRDGRKVSEAVSVSMDKKGVWVRITWVMNSNIAQAPDLAPRS
jgi:similar to stage IV sporulation protein